ncbi:MAG: hypothetical protein KME17_31595 [Cyanosarcina radialis HA8281-LM2]|nr:hypothetical protein [Cyanosarcina radialis HA8281-LM2]
MTHHLPIAFERLQEIANVEVWPERQPLPYEVSIKLKLTKHEVSPCQIHFLE